MSEPFNVDLLAPTQYLVMEVLAARARLGETLWTFPSNVSDAIQSLERKGLVQPMHGIEPKTVRASLTEAGKAAALSATYSAPSGGVDRLRQALELIAEYSEPRADLLIGMDAVARLARQALAGADHG